MHVADIREQVIFHLVVEPAHIPRKQPVFPGEVYRGVHLMNGPVIFNNGLFVWQRGIHILHGMRKLESKSENQSAYSPHHHKTAENKPGMVILKNDWQTDHIKK